MILVDKNKCIKCGKCLEVCPFNVLSLKEGFPTEDSSKTVGCIGCMHCVAICPVGALMCEGLLEERKPSEMPSEYAYEEIKKIIMSNRSIRHFSDELMPVDEIEEILEVAAYAPSAKNHHTNRWILAYGQEKTSQIMKEVLNFAQENGGPLEVISEHKEGNNIVTFDAPHILFGVAPKEGTANPYTDTIIAITDVDLMLNAKGMGSCWAGYLGRISNASEKIKNIIGLDDSMQIFGVLAFGYPKDEKYDWLPHRESGLLSIVK